MPQAEQLTDPVAYHGEGPCWSPSWGLRWVDMLAGDVLTLQDDGAIRREHVGKLAAIIRPRRSGGALVATDHELVVLHEDGRVEPLTSLVDDPAIRLNEGACDPYGEFWCGSMRWDKTGADGRLYQVDAEHCVRTVLTGIGISNGLAWTADGASAFYIDTPTHRVDRFDDGPDERMTGRRPFVQIDPADGVPDGLCVDAAGGVWVAVNGGSQVRRFGPDGTLEDIVELPVPQVTACTFAGAQLDQLVITTSREGIAADQHLQAGALFSYRPGVRGLAPDSYAG